jgi:hypothetical protein
VHGDALACKIGIEVTLAIQPMTGPNYGRRMTIGALLGLGAAALVGSLLTHDNITGAALLLYPVALILGPALGWFSARVSE